MDNMITIPVVNKSQNSLPKYQHLSDAGFDLAADLTNVDTTYFDGCDFDKERNVIIMYPGGRCLVPTELYMAIPEGYELQVRSRSGLALKSGVFVANAPGTVDAGYRSGIGVILYNSSSNIFEINQGDRIAQGVLNKVEQAEFISVDMLPSSERGTNGFGSTGVH